MEVYIFEGKKLDELIENSLKELNIKQEDAIIVQEEIKGSILKKTTYKILIYTLVNIQNYVKEYLQNIIKLMGISVSMESKIRDGQIYIKMYSNNNPVLIGKDGRTLSSLLFIVKQMLNIKYKIYPHIILDVENYKEKHEKKLVSMAKKIANEVMKSKIDVKLDNMNSYERRIIHNTLSDYNMIITVSEGEEPNRHGMIKYKSK